MKRIKDIRDNIKVITFKDLEESGVYDIALLNALKIGDFIKLAELAIEARSDKDFMEPLLYAVRNELNTYKVYEFFSDNIKNDVELATEILINEPDLIEGSPISKNKQFVMINAKANPQVIRYMSPSLKEDPAFISELSSINSPEVSREIANNCNVEKILVGNIDFGNNKDFMDVAIDEDINNIEHLGDELNNNKDFLKEKSSKNEEVIDYVASNPQKFGPEGIKGVQESSKSLTVDDCMNIINEMAEKSSDDRYAKVKEKIQERGLDDANVVRWVTAMVAQNDNVDPEILKKVLNYSILTMEKTKMDLNSTGEMQVNVENMKQLINPSIINKLKEKIQLQGISIDANLQQKIDNYQDFYKEYETKINKQKEQNKAKINLFDIKKVAEEADLNITNETTKETKQMVREEVKTVQENIEEKQVNNYGANKQENGIQEDTDLEK